MTTHYFPYMEAATAFDLLYTRMDEALGVLLDWEVPDAWLRRKTTGGDFMIGRFTELCDINATEYE